MKVLVRTSADMGGELAALVERALATRGAVPCGCSERVLAVNAPGAAPVAACEQPHRDVETHGRDLDRFVAELEEDAARGRTVAIADIAYSGGRERALEEALERARVRAVHLSGDEPLQVLLAALDRLA